MRYWQYIENTAHARTSATYAATAERSIFSMAGQCVANHTAYDGRSTHNDLRRSHAYIHAHRFGLTILFVALCLLW